MPAIRNTRLPKQDRKNYGGWCTRSWFPCSYSPSDWGLTEDHRETYGIMYLKPEPENMITPPFATDISLSPLARSSSSPSWLSGVPSYSHRPKQDHSPRPPNAFLFRPELYKAPKLHLGEDQTNISRIAGQRWKDLAEHEQEPYKRRAKHEKQLHDRRDPDYKYSLSGGCRSEKKVGRKGKKDRKESEEERCRKVAELLIQGIEGADLQRAMKSVDEEASTLSSSSTSRSQCPRPKNTASSHIRVESPQPPDFFFFDHSGSHPNGNFVPTSQIPQLKLSAATPEEVYLHIILDVELCTDVAMITGRWRRICSWSTTSRLRCYRCAVPVQCGGFSV